MCKTFFILNIFSIRGRLCIKRFVKVKKENPEKKTVASLYFEKKRALGKG